MIYLKALENHDFYRIAHKVYFIFTILSVIIFSLIFVLHYFYLPLASILNRLIFLVTYIILSYILFRVALNYYIIAYKIQDYIDDGKRSEAMNLLNKSISRFWIRQGSFLHLYIINLKGVVYIETGEFKRALKTFNKSLEINSNQPIAWYGKACSENELGYENKSTTSLYKSLKLWKNKFGKSKNPFLKLKEKREFEKWVKNGIKNEEHLNIDQINVINLN